MGHNTRHIWEKYIYAELSMKNIFLSYSTKDKEFVKQMRERLTAAGFRPWIDPNPRPGEDWRYEIDDAIRQADALILIATPNSLSSPYITYEWSYALGVGVKVIPVIFKAAPLHPRLMTLQRFDVTGWKSQEHFWDYFLRELHTLLHAPIAAPPPVAPAPPPPSGDVPAPKPVPDFSRGPMPTEAGHWLVMRRGPNLNQMFRLDAKGMTLLGRDVACDISINDPEVSRHHARFTYAGGFITLEDLNSTNGTFVGGVRLSGPQALKKGDVIGLGDAILLSYEVV